LSGVSIWKFDENVTPIFNEHVKQHVPLYEEIHHLVAELAGWFIEDGSCVYDIGTSTGKVISNLTRKYPTKEVRYIGIDLSREMVEKAKNTFKGDSRVRIVLDDITNETFKIIDACLVTSVLTLQFVPQRYRQSLINKVFDGLNEGGGFILVEKVIGNNARFNEMWVELCHELKLKNGVTEEEVFKKARSIRGVLRPLTVNENINLLENAGFKDIDIFFKWNNFVGLIAIK